LKKKLDIALIVYAAACAVMLGSSAIAGTSGFPPRVINPVSPPAGPTPEPLRVIVVNSASIGSGSGPGGGLTDAELRASPVPVSGTVTVTDGAGALNAIVDSGTITAVTSVTNPVTVTDGAGAMNVIVDSGAITATVSDGAGALNVIVDSATLGTVTVSDGAGAMNVIVDSITAGNNNIGDVDVATLPNVTIGTFPDNEPFNVAQINGVTPLMGNGASGTGAQRVTIADNSTGILAGVTTVTTVTNTNNATAANLNAEVQGDTASAAAATGNPVRIGAYVEADGAQLNSTNQAEGDATDLKADVEGRLLVNTSHLNRFSCTLTTTATTSTVITGCTAAGAGLSRYITDISYSSSVISTTANKFVLQYGTGASCGTGTTVVHRAMTLAFTWGVWPMQTPLKLAANTDLCILHAAAGTKDVTIQGYIAP
jgi:hypothetical protein